MHPLDKIPIHDVGPQFPLETLELERARADALIDGATHGVPLSALRGLDVVSRRWLAKQDSVHLDEIDAIADRLGRPGAYFLSVNYEWGCTCRVAPSPEGTSARLVRVLDWVTYGLGRYVIAARVAGRRRLVYHAHLAGLHRGIAGDGTGALFRRAQSGTDAPPARTLLSRLGC